MKALVYDGIETLNYRSMPDPLQVAGEELVRVAAVGICGSDMHAYHGTDPRRPAPLILGHEAAGVIVGGDRDGVRVTVNPLLTCGTCRFCKAGRQNICPDRQIISMPPREGAFADFLTMPAQNLIDVPDDVSFDKAALAEPLAVSWHSVRLGLAALHDSNSRSALVLGGGAIGVAAVLALQAQGIDEVTVVDPNRARCTYLQTHLDCRVAEAPAGLYGIVFDAVGCDATRTTAAAAVEAGGVIVHIGLGAGAGGLDIRRFTLQEITFIGSYCYTPQDFSETAAALFDGRLGALDWIESRALADGAAAFADLDQARVAAPKVILHPAQP